MYSAFDSDLDDPAYPSLLIPKLGKPLLVLGRATAEDQDCYPEAGNRKPLENPTDRAVNSRFGNT